MKLISRGKAREKRRLSLAMAAGALVAGAVIGLTPLAANAASVGISGTNDTREGLYQAPTYRYHDRGGANFTMQSMSPGTCGGSINLGLRNTSGTQITNTLAFSTTNNQIFTVPSSSSPGVLPAGSYAFNTRATGAWCGYYVINWSGVLNW